MIRFPISLGNFQAKYGDLDLVLINSHLESCKEHVVERVNQMSQCFEVMHKAPAYKTVIFGGDMNARDKEVSKRI